MNYLEQNIGIMNSKFTYSLFHSSIDAYYRKFRISIHGLLKFEFHDFIKFSYFHELATQKFVFLHFFVLNLRISNTFCLQWRQTSTWRKCFFQSYKGVWSLELLNTYIPHRISLFRETSNSLIRDDSLERLSWVYFVQHNILSVDETNVICSNNCNNFTFFIKKVS